jgi:hypothetical protein
VRFVNIIVYPTPPTAVPYGTAGQGNIEFIIFISAGAIFLYPALFHCLQVIFPQFRNISIWMFECCFMNSFWSRRQRGPKNERRRICGICSVLSLLYIAGTISAILGTLHLADIKQQNSNLIFSVEDTWAGSYAVLESPTNGSLYSVEGEYLGTLNLIGFLQGWAFQTDVSQPIIGNITYANPLSNMGSTIFQFSASCRSNASCVTGRVTVPPTPPYSNGDNTGPDFEGNLSLIITSLNPAATLNTTNPNAWTSYEAYQGIGENFAPLGYWYLGDDPIVQVVWNTAASGPCIGLQIYLSRDYEGISFVILGLVWEWWIQWNNTNGCEYSTTPGLPIPPDK